MKKHIIAVLLLLLPTTLFAAGFSLTPVPSDQSVNYLGQVFGSVGNVLTGSGGHMIAHIFKMLNYAILTLATIVIIYTLFVSVMNTANDGEMMGKKWNSIWVIIRMTLGIALMLPAKTGYCALQILIMWIIMQGIGAADSVWTATVNSSFMGGTMAPPAYDGSQQNSDSESWVAAQTLLAGQVCVNVMNQIDPGQFACRWAQNDSVAGIVCGSTNATATGDECGGVSYNLAYVQGKFVDPAPIEQAAQTALNTMMTDIQPAATAIAGNSPDFDPKDVAAAPAGAIVNAANDWLKIMGPVTRDAATIQGDINKDRDGGSMQSCAAASDPSQIPMCVRKEMNARGWIDAGNYYLDIAQLTYQTNQIVSTIELSSSLPNAGSVGSGPYSNQVQGYVKGVEWYNQKESDSYFLDPSSPSWITNNKPKQGDADKYVAKAVDDSMDNWSTLFDEYSGTQGTKLNPILMLQTYGHNIIQNALTGYKDEGQFFGNHEFIKAVASHWWGNEQLDNMYEVIWFIPLGATILGMLLTSGAMMELYIPLVPMIFFTLGAIGWIIGVMQAMVAAPIVAFGLLSPNSQNDLMGKSEPAIMLMVNMFLRPTLMILGMVLGMALIYVVIEYFNEAYSVVINGAFNMTGDNMQNPFSAAAMMFLYGSIVTTLVHKCFSLIHIVPDNVLNWIQGGEVTRQQFGDSGAQAEQQLKSGFGQSASGMAQGAGRADEGYANSQISVARNKQSMASHMGGGLGSMASKGLQDLF